MLHLRRTAWNSVTPWDDLRPRPDRERVRTFFARGPFRYVCAVESLRDPAKDFQAALARVQEARASDDPILKATEAANDAYRVSENAVERDGKRFTAPSQYAAESAHAATINAALDEANEVIDLDPEARALALLTMHPEWSDTRIAKEAGVSRTTLYDWPKFKLASALLKAGRNDRPRVQKDGKNATVGGWSDDE
jgi:hypothetical protein